MYNHADNQQASELSPNGHFHSHSLHLSLTLLLAMLIAMTATTFLVQPVAAHAGHNDQPVSAAALDGLMLDELLCGAGGYRIAGTDLCTHGPDITNHDATQPATAANLNSDHAHAIVCDGDGVNGQRVQVMYVRAEDQPDRYAEYIDAMRIWAADADAIYDASAHQTGGHRHIRFVTSADCKIDVLNVVVAATADDTFQALVGALRDQGYNNPSRKYLLFVDANIYCGIASVVSDDSPGADNRSNRIAGYARVDNGCWDGLTIAHELTHTLGGVQNSAPNSTGAWHCVDENDVMCYSDYPYFPTVRYDCTDSRSVSLLDCNHDDYFHTDPPADSYLATHWNVADSAFLIPVAQDDHAALPYLSLTASVDEAVIVAPMTVTLMITLPTTASAANLIEHVEFYEGETELAEINQGAYEVVWQATTPGVYNFSARVYDFDGYFTTVDGMTLTVAPANRALAEEFGVEQVIMLPLVMN